MVWLWTRLWCLCFVLPSFYTSFTNLTNEHTTNLNKHTTNLNKLTTTNWVQKLLGNTTISGEWSIHASDTIDGRRYFGFSRM